MSKARRVRVQGRQLAVRSDAAHKGLRVVLDEGQQTYHIQIHARLEWAPEAPADWYYMQVPGKTDKLAFTTEDAAEEWIGQHRPSLAASIEL